MDRGWADLTQFIDSRYPAVFDVEWLFGGAEREKVETILATLASHVREDYVNSATYHDGKWMVTTIDRVRPLRHQ